MPDIEYSGRGAGRRIAIVVARFNDFVTERLRTGALAALDRAGVAAADVTTVRVPGAFEIPIAAQQAARSGRFDAVVCLGCLIRGETAHFEYISSAVAHGITAAAAATGVPMAFGVLTTNSAETAFQIKKDSEAVIAAIPGVKHADVDVRTSAAPTPSSSRSSASPTSPPPPSVASRTLCPSAWSSRRSASTSRPGRPGARYGTSRRTPMWP